MEKLSGVISKADENQLTQLLRSDRKAQEIWQSLEDEGAQIGVDKFLNTLKPKPSLEQVKKRVAARRSFVVTPAWRYIAAAVVLIVIGGIALFQLDEQAAPVEFPVAETGSDRVQLLTQDGNAIDLVGTAEGEVRAVGDLEIRITGQELQSVQSEKVVMSTLVVPPKLSYRAVLPDGSKVWLNSGSELHFPSRFDGTVRSVTLEGEGYFEVVEDKQKPFIVRAGGTEIEVLGTRFNVSSYHEEPTRTALVEGRVKVSAEDERAVILQPGFISEFSEEGLTLTAFDFSEAIAWVDGIYYFNNASLAALAPIINRWYGVSVSVMNDKLAKHRISGLLERGQLADFLSDLHSSTGISSRIENGTLIFN